MKNLLFIFFTIVTIANISGQSKFKKGYFINSNNEKIECLVENKKWDINPSSFRYKLFEYSNIETIRKENIKELKVENYKFISHTNSTDARLIRYYIEGNASLYSYKTESFEAFYFSSNTDSIIKELKTVKTLLINGKKVGQYNNYKQQLWDNVRCDKKLKEIQKLEFSKTNLVNYFIDYNKCSNSPFHNYLINDGKGQFNIKLKGGVNVSSLLIPSLDSNNNSEYLIDFGSLIGYRIGTELEFVLPISKNNWAVHFEPTYTSLSGETSTLSTPKETVSLEYNTIEIPMGIKRYFNLGSRSRLFLNASYILAFDFDSFVEIENSPPIKFSKFTNWAFGVGIEMDKKYGLEFRYYTSKKNLFEETYYQSEYENISVAFVYTLFRNN